MAELEDGRVAVIEYKGADRTDGPDSREKRNIGARLQEVSDGRVIFAWIDGNAAAAGQLDSALSA